LLKFVDERLMAIAVWRKALAIIRRHPVATVAPVALAGDADGGSLPAPGLRYVLQDVLAFLTEACAFYLYVAYAEELMIEAQQSAESIPLVIPGLWLLTRWSFCSRRRS
jgi:hypothetical protein